MPTGDFFCSKCGNYQVNCNCGTCDNKYLSKQKLEHIMDMSGHNEPCVICGKPCNIFHGNPGLWPVLYYNNGGKKYIHTHCVYDLVKMYEKFKEVFDKNNSH